MSDESIEHPTRLRTLSKLRDASTKAERLGLLSDLLGHFADDDELLATAMALHRDGSVEPAQSAEDERLMALGQAFEATLEWTKTRIGQLVGRSPETLAETVSRAATWLELLGEAMVMAGQGGFHGELFGLLQEAGQAYHGYKAQQQVTAEPDKPAE